MIRKAKINELETILKLALKTKTHMLNHHLHQWVGQYPNLDVFKNDYQSKGLYVYLNDEEQIIASISILEENDAPYKEIKWHTHHSLVIHRLLVDPVFQRQGVGKALFTKAIELTKLGGFKSLKVDTHPDNIKMQALIQTMGFKYVGYLKSINRLAYELIT